MENRCFTVEVLMDANELRTLENEFLNAISEEPLDETAQTRLAQAIREEKIIFFVARNAEKPIGMCSVSPCFSTFACKPCGVFDDFFVRPEYRKQGIARLLTEAAQAWGKEHGFAGLTVGCSQKDVAMYQSLGFDTALGVMLANNL